MDTNQYMVDNALPGVFFDIGAHYGMYTKPMALKATCVYAFEPSSHNYHILVENTKNLPNVINEKIAISNINSTMKLFGPDITLRSDQEYNGFSINPELVSIPHLHRSFENYEEIPTISVDEYCKINNITNITGMKIDVEAAEEFVLEGALNTLNNNNILLSLETHLGINRQRIYELLKQVGYSIYLNGTQKVEHIEYDCQYICKK
jgi:FkbM family methyltransferase